MTASTPWRTAAGISRVHGLILLLALAATTAAFRSELRPLRDDDTRLLLDENLNDEGAHLKTIGSVTGNGSFGIDGLELAPGQHIDVRLAVVAPPANAVSATLWTYDSVGVTNSVECSTDGRTFVALARDLFGAGRTLSVTAACLGGPQLVLRIFVARDAAAPPGQVLGLDKVQLVSRAADASAPGLVPLTAAWIFVAVTVCGAALLVPGIRWTIAAAAASVTLLAVAHVWRPGLFMTWGEGAFDLTAITALAGLGAIAVFILTGGQREAEALLVVCLLTLGFAPRWQALVGSLSSPLSPDAATIQDVAAAMTHPYDTWVREPFWIWLVRASTFLWGNTAAALRMFSLVCSLLWLAATYWFSRIFFDRVVPALASLTLMALHRPMILSSAEAHRTELYGALLIVVAGLAMAPRLRPVVRTVLLAASVSMVALTQLAGVIPAFAAVLWSWSARRISVAAVVAIVATTAIFLVPNAIYTQRKFGQAFYFSRTLVPTFYRNVEFMMRTRTGCDGCPTVEQMAQSSYSGRPASMFEYLFRLHSVGEVGRRLLHGYALVFLWPGRVLAAILGSSSVIVYALYMTGLIVAMATGAREALVVPLLSLNLLAFVVPLGVEPRLLLHVAPFSLVLVVLGGLTLCQAAVRLAPSRWYALEHS